ncbi:MAG: outer membrane lipoprotein-sorting protein [Endomicrobiia bacterium]
MKKLFYLIFLTLKISLFAITAEEILKKVDENLNFQSAIITARLEIYLPNESIRIKKFKSYISGKNAYTEFLNKEDKNIRYLKLNKQMWVYDTEEENIFLISGHLLKQGMMGSDISYEDALESNEIYNFYNIRSLAEEEFNQRSCYLVELIAKTKNVSYYKRKMWIDKEYFIPLKEQRFAINGKLLKTFENYEIKFYKNRVYTAKSVVLDNLKQNTKTVVVLEEAEFDIEIPQSYFSKRYLQR